MSETEDTNPTAAVFRAIYQSSSAARVGNPQCDEPGCVRTTRENKPYCSEHVERAEYVQALMAELELRDSEADALVAGKPIAADGHLVRETLLMLRQGSYTSAKLSRLMDISHEATEALIRYLHERQLAIMSKTDRGAIIIRSIAPLDDDACGD